MLAKYVAYVTIREKLLFDTIYSCCFNIYLAILFCYKHRSRNHYFYKLKLSYNSSYNISVDHYILLRWTESFLPS